MPLILNEDAALHTSLQGITVSDQQNSSRAVGVWFGQPDIQIRDQSFPYLTIDLIDVVEDNSRASRGYGELPYLPEGWTAPTAGTKYVTDTPIPLALDYQITSYARHPRHDRQIISAMYKYKTPTKFGGLYIPEDNTVRPMFLTSFMKRDGTENGKRLFSNVFSVRVFSEMLIADVVQVQQATKVTVTMPTITTYPSPA